MITEKTRYGDKLINVLRYMNQINCQNTEGDYVQVVKYTINAYHEEKSDKDGYKSLVTAVNNAWNCYFYDEPDTVIHGAITDCGALAEVQSAFNRFPASQAEVAKFAQQCHRTIQQNLMRFIRDYIVEIATDWTLSFDDRNKASQSFAKSLWASETAQEIIKNATFPYI